jgi:hypothetical protein
VKQRAAIRCRLDTLAASIEEAHTDRMFKFCNCSRNCRLSGTKALCRFAHAFGLNYGRKHVEVLELNPTPNELR